MNQADWPSDWLRGVLELAVLRVLTEGPSYGYAIAGRLDEAGFGAIKGGTLYPLLTRLEAAGDLATEWRAGDGGPGRKYFALTDAGLARTRALTQQWARFEAGPLSFLTLTHTQENTHG